MHQGRNACRWTAALLTVLAASPALAQGLADAAARERQRREAARQAAGSSLVGSWNGSEDEGGSRRFPTLTFSKDGGTITYETSSGATALRVDSLKLEGASVRFAVTGLDGTRHYLGSLSGDSITGKISRDEAGRNPLGSFQLVRGAPSVLMHAPSEVPPARLVTAPLSSGGGGRASRAASDSSPTETDMRRQAGEQRLSSTLSSLASQAQALARLVQQYQGQCAGSRVYTERANSCDSIYSDIGRYALSIGRGLERAEDDARKDSVLPGRVRELRTQYGLDHRFWDELSSLANRIEREHKSRR